MVIVLFHTKKPRREKRTLGRESKVLLTWSGGFYWSLVWLIAAGVTCRYESDIRRLASWGGFKVRKKEPHCHKNALWIKRLFEHFEGGRSPCIGSTPHHTKFEYKALSSDLSPRDISNRWCTARDSYWARVLSCVYRIPLHELPNGLLSSSRPLVRAT